MRLCGGAASWGVQAPQHSQPTLPITTRCSCSSVLPGSRHVVQKATLSARRAWDDSSLIILSHEQLSTDAYPGSSLTQQTEAFRHSDYLPDGLTVALPDTGRNGIPSSSEPAGPLHTNTGSLLHDALERRRRRLAQGAGVRRPAQQEQQQRRQQQQQQQHHEQQQHSNGDRADHAGLDDLTWHGQSSSTVTTWSGISSSNNSSSSRSSNAGSVDSAQLCTTSQVPDTLPSAQQQRHARHEPVHIQQPQAHDAQAQEQSLQQLQQTEQEQQQQQQQQASRQPASSNSTATPPSNDNWMARKLTADVKHCTSWRSLEQLLDHVGDANLNHIHVCAMVTHTTRVVRYHALPAEEQEAFHAFYCRLLDLAFERLGQGAGPREAANQLWAIAKLGLHPGAEWLNAYLMAGLGLVRGFRSQEVGPMAWALAKFSHAPPQEWTGEFLEQARREMRWLDAQALSNLLWSMAALGLQLPDAAWADALGGALVESARAMSAQGLANTLWALGRMGVPKAAAAGRSKGQRAALPAPAAFDALLAAAAARPRAFRVGEAAMLLHAVARLRLQAPQRLWSELQELTLGAFSALSYAEAANMLWALAVSGQTPQPAWLEACLDHLAARAHTADAQALGNTFHALVRLGHQPADYWWDAVLAQVAVGASSFDRRALATTCLCLAKLGPQMGPEARHALQEATADSMAAFNSQELANVAYGMAGMRGGAPPSRGWCIELERAALHHMPAASPQEVANTALALARMKHHPAAAYMDALQQYVRSRAGELKEIDRAQLQRAMQSLSARAARAAAKAAARAAVVAAVGDGNSADPSCNGHGVNGSSLDASSINGSSTSGSSMIGSSSSSVNGTSMGGAQALHPPEQQQPWHAQQRQQQRLAVE